MPILNKFRPQVREDLEKVMRNYERAIQDLEDTVKGRSDGMESWSIGTAHFTTLPGGPAFFRVIERAIEDGLTAGEIAELAHVDTDTVRRWENNLFKPHPRIRNRIERKIKEALREKRS